MRRAALLLLALLVPLSSPAGTIYQLTSIHPNAVTARIELAAPPSRPSGGWTMPASVLPIGQVLSFAVLNAPGLPATALLDASRGRAMETISSQDGTRLDLGRLVVSIPIGTPGPLTGVMAVFGAPGAGHLDLYYQGQGLPLSSFGSWVLAEAGGVQQSHSPEPASVLMMATGLVSVFLVRKRNRPGTS
jgi:hypothetical protein